VGDNVGNRGDRLGDRGNLADNRGDRLENRGDRFENRQENRGDRRENRQENRGDRFENRGDRLENRGDRLENRGDRIENRGDWVENAGDWANNSQDYWGNVHNDWYNGSWNGNWGYGSGWYDNPWAAWGVGTAAWGLTNWGAGSLFYDTGYYGYENPYYVPTATVAEYPVVNYSQPIVTTSVLPEPTAPTVVAAVSESDAARDAFYQGDYAKALASADAALSKTPSDIVLHQLRAQCLFAMQKYKNAAATLYAVLSVTPGWDWTTMSGLYPDVDTYTKQLRTLEDYVRQNPDSADARFDLAYHYLTQGHREEAAKQLQEAVRIVPNDQVSRQLLSLVSPSEGGAPSATADQAPPAAAPGAEPDSNRKAPSNIIGSWKAPATGGGTVELTLAEDGRFTWKLTRGDKTQSFDGQYEVTGTALVLDYSNGGTMVGRLNSEGPDRFTFKMVGGPANDLGLAFQQTKT
jgi:tetratricopeptide (TPR) repeat protein